MDPIEINVIRTEPAAVVVTINRGGGDGAGPSGPVAWGDVQDKPAAFPPAAHRHPASEIDGIVQPADGRDGWSALYAAEPDGERVVLRIADWAGGTGPKPATGGYAGPLGVVATAAEATDLRGPASGGGAASGSSLRLAVTLAGQASVAGQGFRRVPLDNVRVDDDQAWDAGNHWWTVPATGDYEIVTKLRLSDGGYGSLSYGQGADIGLGDSPDFLWSTPAAGGRSGLINVRRARLQAGSQLQLVTYLDTGATLVVVSAAMSVVRL